MVHRVRGLIGPREKRRHEDKGDRRQAKSNLVSANTYVAVGFEAQVRGAVQREQRQCAEPAKQGVGLHEVKEVSRPRGVRRERYSVHEVRKSHAPKKRRQRRSPEDRPVPPRHPFGVFTLVAELERHSPENECCEDEEQRQIEAAEDSRVPEREGGKGRPTRGQEPDFVPVPHWANGVDDHPAIEIVLRHERQQRAHAEVEPFEEEVAQPEDEDQEEPQLFKAAG